jgi:hypothetical protein
MSVERMGNWIVQRYIGLSIDDKPLPIDDNALSLLVGAQFHETDTNLKYEWNGSQWVLYSIPSGTPLKLIQKDQSATVSYIGEAPVGSNTSDPAWRIKRIDTSTGIEILWADGDATFTKIVDNSTGYTYL